MVAVSEMPNRLEALAVWRLFHAFLLLRPISLTTRYQYTSRILMLRLRGSKQLADLSLGRKR